MSSQGRQVTVGDFKAGPREFEYVNQVLRSGRLSYGPFSRRFEQEWAEAHGAKHAVFCNSGTSALHIAVQALKKWGNWRDGDEVIVPSVTFVATANVCLHNGLKPVFVDVDERTYNMDPLRLEEKIVPGTTRAIIPVHLCGQPADMPAITNVAHRYGLSVIEDSCETAFADCHGKPVGSWGDVGCFSTYMAHYIVTGVGGLATTGDPKLAAELRSLMNHGRDGIYISIDDDDGKTREQMKEIISRRFKFEEPGHSFRCTELEAALGCAQLERRHDIVYQRKRIAALYTEGLRGVDGVKTPTTAEGVEHVFMMYPLVTKTPEIKAGLVQHLEDHGIETRDLLPLLNQPVYHRLYGKNLINQYPVAKKLDGCGFYIGTHQYITDDDVAYVVDTIKKFFNG